MVPPHSIPLLLRPKSAQGRQPLQERSLTEKKSVGSRRGLFSIRPTLAIGRQNRAPDARGKIRLMRLEPWSKCGAIGPRCGEEPPGLGQPAGFHELQQCGFPKFDGDPVHLAESAPIPIDDLSDSPPRRDIDGHCSRGDIALPTCVLRSCFSVSATARSRVLRRSHSELSGNSGTSPTGTASFRIETRSSQCRL